MPLLPTTLVTGLNNLESPEPPKNTVETAQRWTDLWWDYASGCIYLFPASLVASKALATSVFRPLISVALLPCPIPLTFFLGLEGAMRAAWATLSTPVSLTPPLLSITPAPIPFAPLGLAMIPVGMLSPTKQPPRVLLAALIHTWTITHIVVGPSGPVGPML